ncbi:ribonuclease P protein subunit p40-like [Dermacentor andersoni]|uniref:ribonuclease P protein subunit p40-like n=1 Tax=Dermacentor andersoni TaxID=34620 RepID=UPI0021559E32|nr:ribonuclease P protein subunit p40-like [Dermacentor andersoni]
MWPDFPRLHCDIDIYLSNFGDPTERWQEAIRRCNFIHSVQLVLPELSRIPEDVQSLMAAQNYHVVRNIHAKELVAWDLVKTFVRQGKLHLLSINTNVSYGNCVAVTADGELHLSLQEEVFRVSGLEGSRFAGSSKGHCVFGSVIDLQKQCFHPEKNNYKRTLHSLDRCGDLVAQDVAIVWEPLPEHASLSPSSAARYFSQCGHTVIACKPSYSSTTQFCQVVPTAVTTLEYMGEDAYLPVYEWLGAIACGVDSRDNKDAREQFLSSHHLPGPSTEVSRLFVANWKGFFTPTCAIRLLLLLRQCMAQEDLPFFGLVLHRFDDDPTQPLSKHQSLLLSRASELSIICTPNGRYCLLHSPK